MFLKSAENRKEDKKVVFEYPMMDYMLGKVTNNFEIVMEH